MQVHKLELLKKKTGIFQMLQNNSIEGVPHLDVEIVASGQPTVLINLDLSRPFPVVSPFRKVRRGSARDRRLGPVWARHNLFLFPRFVADE